jgi:hypothetical protein
MNRSRLLTLVGLKATISQQAVRREAQKLSVELVRLNALLKQITQLDLSYKEHLSLPALRSAEYRDTVSILASLQDRRNIDTSRLDMLTVERDRLVAILAEKQRHIDRLGEEAQRARKNERAERERIQETLIPERRK